jgi:hypothetical protein
MKADLSLSDSEHLGMVSPKDVAIVVDQETLPRVCGIVHNKFALVNIVKGELDLCVFSALFIC